MKVSRLWLQEFVDIQRYSDADIARSLTDSGLEVESTETVSTLQGEVVIGEILTAEKHPDADQLRVCTVDVGNGEPLTIVCGAPNARAGIRACVAKVGATLPGDFKIKKSKIRGVNSEGMMCAEDELGLSSNHDSIIELEPDAPLGQSVAEHFKLNDTVWTLGITPNRADCLGVMGVARDLAAKLQLPFKPRQFDRKVNEGATISISIEQASDCPRFVALALENVKVGPSPSWLKRRLEAVGLRPVNNIVDCANLVMMEWGQPVHTYDRRFVENQSFVVRRARSGETLETLDGVTRQLSPHDIVISDSRRVLGIAGVMGGKSSEIREDTTGILLEVAQFDPRQVRKTSKRLGLHSEASHRFERGVDGRALERVTLHLEDLISQVLRETHPGDALTRVSRCTDCDQHVTKVPNIALRVSRARKILGLMTLEGKLVIDRLQRLGLVLVDQTADQERLLFAVPSWRHDLHREIDLIEELGRLIGYDQVVYQMPSIEMGGLKEDDFIAFIDQCKQKLAGIGLNETVSFPFYGDDDIRRLMLASPHYWCEGVSLRNPLAENESLMRTNLLVGLLKAALRNQNAGVSGVKLFEVGRGYFRNSNFEQGQHIPKKARGDVRTTEVNFAAWILTQPTVRKCWESPSPVDADFFTAKKLLLEWICQYGSNLIPLRFEECDDMPFLHPGCSASVWHEQTHLGFIGQIHPAVVKSLDFKDSPVVAHINLDRLFALTQKELRVSSAAGSFPPFKLDLSFVVERSTSYRMIEELISGIKPKRYLKSFELFDIYTGPQLSEDKKSIALTLNFSSDRKTLSEKDVEPDLQTIKLSLQESLGAEFR